MSQDPIVRQIVKYSFFKLDPAWRRIPSAERELHRQEFTQAANSLKSSLLIRTYSTVGMRGDTDFLIWMVHENPRVIGECHAHINHTGLAGYLSTPYSYLATTRRSMYVDKHDHPGGESSRTRITPRDANYLFVYPFVKTRPWYALSQDERQKMMTQHIAFGHKFPDITINTSYSFGIDDQEFVVAFEGNDIQQFTDLVMELRHTSASAYTLRDTPAFTCLRQPIEDILRELG